MQYHHEDIWPLTFFIDGYDFLNQQGKITMKPRWQFTCNKSLLKFATMLGVVRWPWYHHLNLKRFVPWWMLNLSKFKWWVCLNDITFFFKSSTRVNTPISKHYTIAKHLPYLLCFLFFLLRFSWLWAPPIEVLQNLFNFIDIGATKKKQEEDKLVQK